ncbi:MAG: four helix bundle protein [Bacteroidetes bacterium]|nr:MAG: four helix bundle protein [Bacteroidota bacterium]
MKIYSFEKLEVWQRGREMVKAVYQLSGDFPAEEKFSLTQQIRRACTSVTCNLAEGTARYSGRDQARFSEIAFGSLMEVLNLLITAVDLEYISEERLFQQRPLIEEIGNKINALRESQLRRGK